MIGRHGRRMNDVMEGKHNFRNHHVYAVYRGDEYVTDGTLEEIGKTLGMTRKSLFLVSDAVGQAEA